MLLVGLPLVGTTGLCGVSHAGLPVTPLVPCHMKTINISRWILHQLEGIIKNTERLVLLP